MCPGESGRALTHDIVVVGASTGGVQALREILRGLPRDFPGAVLVAMHLSPRDRSRLPDILNRSGALPAEHPSDGQVIEHGRVYIAPPNHHLLFTATDRLGVSCRAPTEKGFRPAVDPLFRTAALRCGKRVVGVVLTGAMDDGTAGLIQVKAHGGIAVVQDPSEALLPNMPLSAICNVEVDYVVRLAQIPGLLLRLAAAPVPIVSTRRASIDGAPRTRVHNK